MILFFKGKNNKISKQKSQRNRLLFRFFKFTSHKIWWLIYPLTYYFYASLIERTWVFFRKKKLLKLYTIAYKHFKIFTS